MPYSTCFGSSIVSQDVSKKGHKLVPSLKLTAKAIENQWFEDGPFLVGLQTPIFRGVEAVSFRGLVLATKIPT